MNAPTATTVRHGTGGRGTRNTAGRTTAVNRSARNSSGGTPGMPQSMTTKLKPQTMATRVARSAWRRLRDAVMPASLDARIVKHQRLDLHRSM